VIVGDKPSPPINLKIIEVIPSTKIWIGWEPGVYSGGVPLREFILNVNGVDQATLIDPSLKEFDYLISTGLGSSYVFKLKAVNDILSSDYSEPKNVLVGIIPNPPTIVSSYATSMSLRLSWTPDTVIVNNVPTLGYKIYGKTLTMDDYELFKTVDSLTTTFTI